ncbi:MAG: helix-turn-helix transcriptional regulator [Flavipsychrobacter sp.]|nr:helix-turn-helix transcriptional regulator [Flavipsychrobacter sp.]
MTNNSSITNHNDCPGQEVLNVLTTKWVPNIFRMVERGPVRFSELLKEISGANKQSISVALHKLEDFGLIEKKVIKQKPLHIEYNLSENGRSVIDVFKAIPRSLTTMGPKEK